MNWLQRSALLLLAPVLFSACKDTVAPKPDSVDPIQPGQPGTPGTPGQPPPAQPAAPTNPPPSSPSDSREGIFQFSVNGALVGTFDARGEFQTESPTQTSSFAAGVGNASRLSVAALHLVNPPRGNVFLLEVRNAQIGASIPITSLQQCSTQTEQSCAYGVFIQDREPATEVIDVTTDPLAFNLTSGSVILTEVSSQRARGVFSGQATRASTGAVISLTNGGFNVPIVGEIGSGN